MENVSNDSLEVPCFAYSGILTAPASKSYLQRAIAIGSLCNEPCLINNFYPSKDALAALGIAENLGASVQISGDSLTICKGSIFKYQRELHCGESGLSTRMFSPIAALQKGKTSIFGSGSLLNRPITMIENALKQLGVETLSNHGFLPLELQGPLRPGNIVIDGSESSQLLTGLLIALPTLETRSVIHVKNLKSIPYIQMTLDILNHFGISIDHNNFETFWISGNQKPNAQEYHVEGDWSGAAFHLVGAAISGEVTLLGLNPRSSQADRKILEALQKSGAGVLIGENGIQITKKSLQSFDFDATHCPDLFPSLAVLATCCSGESRIKGVSRLEHKESNRACSIRDEFAKLNIKVVLDGDVMQIQQADVIGGLVNSQNDHRIAMAAAILASVSSTPITIENARAVNKSYPTFFDELQNIWG